MAADIIYVDFRKREPVHHWDNFLGRFVTYMEAHRATAQRHMAPQLQEARLDRNAQGRDMPSLRNARELYDVWRGCGMKRYDLMSEGHYAEPVESEDGEWVPYEVARELLEALEASTEVLIGEFEGYYSCCSINGEVPDQRDRDELERRMTRVNANKAAIAKAKS